jgi:tetratricopeptide (TPR) repeat protein
MRRVEPLQTELTRNSSASAISPVKLKFGVAFYALAVVILGLLFWAYSKHFDNEFEFDDAHCIVQNSALDTMNIGAFMTDPSTYSTLPANQAWRPGITIMNSFDTIRSEKRVPDPFQFHLNIFISYIITGVLVFFMLLWFVRKSFPDLKWANIAAMFGTGLFWLHTANAETINYIIARSDSQSTLFIVLGVVMFQYSEISRKYFLYIIPMALGFLFKESAIMLAPILVVFCWLFTDNFRKNFLALGITFVAAGILYFISASNTPETWTPGGGSPFLYLCTQAFVIVHYFFTFILPVNLSADTDWTYVTSPFDTRVMAGAVFILALFIFAVRWSRNKETRLASFGIFWFFLALAPTSSIVPFSEVMNDHRIFFPFIGLVMVALNFGILGYRKLETAGSSFGKFLVQGFVGILLIAHAIGTHTRCEVWNNNETLWTDATIKSPNNGRAWMNYGLAIMPRNLDSAIIAFDKTLALSPYYSYAHINMGVAQDKKGNSIAAEQYFMRALQLDSINPEAYYYYAEWLIRYNRSNEAKPLLEKGLKLSPSHGRMSILLTGINGGQNSALGIALATADQNPNAENLVALSLQWYYAGEFLQCVRAAEKALAFDSTYAPAWINICVGYNKLGEWDKAIPAGEKAFLYAPQDPLSIGNLDVSKKEKIRFDAMTKQATEQPSYDRWISLSLEWYTAGNFRKSLEAAQEAVKMNPNDATGYNNVCAAANKLGEFDIAVEAGENAVRLKPEWELAKNNLAEAKKGKAPKNN